MDEEKEGYKESSKSKPQDIPQPNENTSFPNLGASAMFPAMVPASPPTFITFEQIMKAAEDVSKSGFNMALAHEIAINKDFKLNQHTPQSELEGKVTEIVHKAFWDILTEQLTREPPVYDQAIVLLTEVKELLLWLLLPHSTRLKNEINEVLDIDLIRQQAENGVLDFLSYAQFIISTMARICAPARDPNIQELRQLTEIVPLYKGILKTLELMKIDMVNFTISRIRPHIQQHSIGYEQAKFKEILQSLEGLTPPVDGLRFTRLWLQKTSAELLEVANDVLPSALILRKAYLKILSWKKDEYFPETLHLDHERFISLKDDLTVMILTATVILVTFSHVGPAIQGIADFKNKLKEHVLIILKDVDWSSPNTLETKLEALGIKVSEDVNECLQNHGFSALSSEQTETLVLSIKKIANDDHAVRQLISKRVFEFLELAMFSQTSLKIPAGLSSLQNELSVFGGQFLSLIRHNQAVFGEYYTQIIDQCKSAH